MTIMDESTRLEECCSLVAREPMGAAQAGELARRLKALAEPTRLRLLSMIGSHEGAEACVCDLTEPLGLSQPTVSHHLKVLSEAGFLARSNRGKWAYYRVIDGALEGVATSLVA